MQYMPRNVQRRFMTGGHGRGVGECSMIVDPHTLKVWERTQKRFSCHSVLSSRERRRKSDAPVTPAESRSGPTETLEASSSSAPGRSTSPFNIPSNDFGSGYLV